GATARHNKPTLLTVVNVTLASSRRQAYAESIADIVCAGSAAGHALRVDVKCVERMARGHEQPVAIAPAEADVGAAFRQIDVTDRLAGGIEHPHAVELGRAHAPAAPQIAVDIDPQAVGRAARAGIDQHL